MYKSDFAVIKDDVKADPDLAVGKILNRDIPNSYLDEMRIKIIQLMEKLPEKGRLSHGFLPPEAKKEVEKLAIDIIKEISITNPGFSMEFEAYKKSARDLAKLYHAEKRSDGTDNIKGMAAIDKAEKRALADLTKRLANQLLKSIKNIDYNQYLYGKEEHGKRKTKAIQRNATMNILSSLFKLARQTRRVAHTRPRHWGQTERIEARRDMVKNLEIPRNNSGSSLSSQQDGDGWER